jgi:hypothetical protein
MAQPDTIEFVPAPPPGLTHVEDLDLEAAKPSAEHVENASITEKKAVADLERDYVDGDDAKPRTGLRRLFRSNPSLEFMREVAEANTQPLDPVEVKKVSEREAI